MRSGIREQGMTDQEACKKLWDCYQLAQELVCQNRIPRGTHDALYRNYKAAWGGSAPEYIWNEDGSRK